MIRDKRKYFEQVLDETIHKEAFKYGDTKLSYKATMSALLLNLYRDEQYSRSSRIID